jgi:hypothetical protein
MSNVVIPPLHSFCNTAEARRVASYILGYACHNMHVSLTSSGIPWPEGLVVGLRAGIASTSIQA